MLLLLLLCAEAGGVYQVELGSLTSSPMLELCTSHAYSPQLSVAAAATQLLTQLAVSCHQESILLPDVDILSEAMQVGCNSCHEQLILYVAVDAAVINEVMQV